jgi:MFS family permease
LSTSPSSVYLSIGLPLAVLPPYVHLRMGYSAALAGLVISIQYIATLFSRPWAGRISDRAGAKVSVLWGMGACTTSGALLMVAGRPALDSLAQPCLFLILSRLVLGVGESLGSTGSTLWGITSAGPSTPPRSSPSTASAPMAPWRWALRSGVVARIRSGAWPRSACSPC